MLHTNEIVGNWVFRFDFQLISAIKICLKDRHILILTYFRSCLVSFFRSRAERQTTTLNFRNIQRAFLIEFQFNKPKSRWAQRPTRSFVSAGMTLSQFFPDLLETCVKNQISSMSELHVSTTNLWWRRFLLTGMYSLSCQKKQFFEHLVNKRFYLVYIDVVYTKILE